MGNLALKYKNVEDLIAKLSAWSELEATEKLAEFFVDARFRLSSDQFHRQYVDGKDDGGIDFCHSEDDTFFILQSKFASKPHRSDPETIGHELGKLNNTLNGHNPNSRAEEFVNALHRSIGSNGLLEVIWITTNIMEQSVIDTAQKLLNKMKRDEGWELDVDFVPIDKNSLQRMIFDIAHGYIPYTGRKTLKIEGGYIENRENSAGVYSLVCTVKVNDILVWFKQKSDVQKFLQKNIRDYIGETKINREIKKSYANSPDWFWYKHNGIIIFADSISKSPNSSELVLRNPQVVNGGQTLIALFSAYDQAQRKDSTADVLVRFYRLPYEDSETYHNSIEIIKALNSQNPIRASDLHSTDPRQVIVESLMKQLGYGYWRRRGKEAKSGRYSVTMRNLALYYYMCRKHVPHEGVRGEVEQIFEEDQKYDETFPEDSINKELSINHVALNYVTVWNIAEALDTFISDLRKYTRELSQYTWFFVLADIYGKLLDWRAMWFDLHGWRYWKEFIESDELKEGLWQYARRGFEVGTAIIPRNEEPRRFFKTKEATQRFASKVTSARGFNTAVSRSYNIFKRSLND